MNTGWRTPPTAYEYQYEPSRMGKSCPRCGSWTPNLYLEACKAQGQPDAWHFGYDSTHVMDSTGTYCFYCRGCDCHAPGVLMKPCTAAPLDCEVKVL